MLKFYNTEKGKLHKRKCSEKSSIILREKIQRGEWTPCITNTWTHWRACIYTDTGIKKFRSSWEACFWVCNQQYSYETIRVRSPGKVYVGDFFDLSTSTLIEIKPISRYNIEIDKMNALRLYCEDNNITFIWLNEYSIKPYIDESKFEGKNIEQLDKLKRAWKNLKS